LIPLGIHVYRDNYRVRGFLQAVEKQGKSESIEKFTETAPRQNEVRK
jgi:hypothetical protein